MLQQTQVSRVIPRYQEFLAAFPDPAALAAAPLSRALGLWQGLGYNRRCLALRRAAGEIVARFGGRVPREAADLESLPGVGPYIAGAVSVFAFGKPVPLIETNIRRVFLHWFFPGEGGVGDERIRPIVERTMDRRDPRTWFNALMDYGSASAAMAAGTVNPNRRSRHYARQARFEGSTRQLRGRVLALVIARGSVRAADVEQAMGEVDARLPRVLEALEAEGFLRRRTGRYEPA